MIAVDTSALMAIVLDEPDADAILDELQDAERIVISSVTLAEALIVARRRNVASGLSDIVASLAAEIAPVTRETAEKAAGAYDKWGKGVHPAGLNICDCFAYVLAKEFECPLLYVGEDFTKTDVRSALAGS